MLESALARLSLEDAPRTDMQEPQQPLRLCANYNCKFLASKNLSCCCWKCFVNLHLFANEKTLLRGGEDHGTPHPQSIQTHQYKI